MAKYEVGERKLNVDKLDVDELIILALALKRELAGLFGAFRNDANSSPISAATIRPSQLAAWQANAH